MYNIHQVYYEVEQATSKTEWKYEEQLRKKDIRQHQIWMPVITRNDLTRLCIVGNFEQELCFAKAQCVHIQIVSCFLQEDRGYFQTDYSKEVCSANYVEGNGW